MCDDFGDTVNLPKFAHILKKGVAKASYQEAYYLTSILSYEMERCELHGKSILHYIIIVLKIIIKRLLRFILRLLVQLVMAFFEPPVCFRTSTAVARHSIRSCPTGREFVGFRLPIVGSWYCECRFFVIVV